MATVSATILKHHKKQDGSWNVKIRITHKGESKYIDTSIYAGKSDVDTKIRLKKVFVDTYLTATVNEYRAKLNSLGPKVDHMSAGDIKDYLSVNDEVIDFIKYSTDNIDQLKRGPRRSTGIRRQTSLNMFKTFLGKDQFSTELLTSKVLKNFEKHLLGLKYSVFTIRNTMADLKTLFNEAKFEYNDEELGLVRIHNSPFSRYKMLDVPESRKKGLDIDVEKLKFIRDIEILNPFDAFSRDLFMLSFYMLGTNANDFHSYLINPSIDRFEYTRNKTKSRRRDKAFISIKVVEEARPLVEKFAGVLQNSYKTPKGLNNRLYQSFKINLSGLFGVKDFTYYHARHAFGTMAGNLGFTDSDIEMALNHKTQTMASVYVARDWEKIDEIQRAVLDLLK